MVSLRLKSAHPVEVIALALFAATAILSFNAVKLGTTMVPLRFVTLVASGLLLLASDYGLAAEAWQRFRRLLVIVILAAGLALLSSLSAGTSLQTVAVQIAQLHLQAIISVFVAGMLAIRFGTKPVAAILLGSFGLTALFAVAQALGLDAAWNVRATIGSLSNDPVLTRQAYERQERAMGLSFSPVIFATQGCAMLAMMLAPVLLQRLKAGASLFDWRVLALCAGMSLLFLATGNRSPLLGVAIFLLSYLLLVRPAWAALALPLAAAVVLAGQPLVEHFQSSEVRALRSDSSSENRGVLREFGVYLIAERPLGYGLDFESTSYSEEYYGQVVYTSSPNSIRQWALHNYYLMVTAKHGLLLLLLLFLVVPRTRPGWAALWVFTPYMVHVFYHNDGPLQGDFIIFFVFPLVAMWVGMAAPEAFASGKPVWRRAFGDARMRRPNTHTHAS